MWLIATFVIKKIPQMGFSIFELNIDGSTINQQNY
jgi:hypothetical protein